MIFPAREEELETTELDHEQACGCFFCPLPYLSTHTVYQYKIQFLLDLGGIWPSRKIDTGNIIFMRFCCCFKLSKKIENTVE